MTHQAPADRVGDKGPADRVAVGDKAPADRAAVGDKAPVDRAAVQDKFPVDRVVGDKAPAHRVAAGDKAGQSGEHKDFLVEEGPLVDTQPQPDQVDRKLLVRGTPRHPAEVLECISASFSILIEPFHILNQSRLDLTSSYERSMNKFLDDDNNVRGNRGVGCWYPGYKSPQFQTCPLQSVSNQKIVFFCRHKQQCR